MTDKEASKKYRIDPEKTMLIGHSLGGAAAIINATKIPVLKAVISIAGANMYGFVKSLYGEKSEEFIEYLNNCLSLNVNSAKGQRA